MKCFKCSKEMERADSNGTMKGIVVDVIIDKPNRTQETIAYNNLQLGKYSDGKGECHVGICYECYIDGLFNMYEGVNIARLAKELHQMTVKRSAG